MRKGLSQSFLETNSTEETSQATWIKKVFLCEIFMFP
jgi:hypothetical protein